MARLVGAWVEQYVENQTANKNSADGAVEVYVLDNERALDDHGSEHDQGPPFPRDDDDQTASPSTRSTATQGFLHTPTTGHSPATNSHGGSFLNELPMRNSQQAPPTAPVIHDIATHHHSFVEENIPVNGAAPVNAPGTGMSVDMVSSPQDGSRRPSVYGEYSNVSNNGIYAQQWQPATTTPNAQPLYAQQTNPPAQPFVQAVPVTNTQSYVPNSFVDSISRQGYDPNHGQMFRPNEVPPPVNQQQGYNYLPNDGRGMPALPGVSEVIDSVPRGHM